MKFNNDNLYAYLEQERSLLQLWIILLCNTVPWSTDFNCKNIHKINNLLTTLILSNGEILSQTFEADIQLNLCTQITVTTIAKIYNPAII